MFFGHLSLDINESRHATPTEFEDERNLGLTINISPLTGFGGKRY